MKQIIYIHKYITEDYAAAKIPKSILSWESHFQNPNTLQ